MTLIDSTSKEGERVELEWVGGCMEGFHLEFLFHLYLKMLRSGDVLINQAWGRRSR